MNSARIEGCDSDSRMVESLGGGRVLGSWLRREDRGSGRGLRWLGRGLRKVFEKGSV